MAHIRDSVTRLPALLLLLSVAHAVDVMPVDKHTPPGKVRPEPDEQVIRDKDANWWTHSIDCTVNVRQYGAIPTTGDSWMPTTPDQAPAIQAAIDAAAAVGYHGGTICFPPGKYYIAQPLLWKTAHRLHFVGYGATIWGPVDYMLDKSDYDNIVEGPSTILGLHFLNTLPGGSGIRILGMVGLGMHDVRITGTYSATPPGDFIGVNIAGNTFSYSLVDNRIEGFKIGVMTGGHVNMLGNDIVGCTEGIRAYGAGIAIVGGRYEVNDTAIELGKKPDGTNWLASRVSVSGASFERNGTAIDLHQVKDASISGVGIMGSVVEGYTPSTYGVLVGGASATTISGVEADGQFVSAAWRLENGWGGVTIQNSTAGNSYPGGLAWDIADRRGFRFSNNRLSGDTFTDLPVDDSVIAADAATGRIGALEMGVLIPEDANVTGHVYFRGSGLIDRVSTNTWTDHGTVSQVAASGRLPAGAGPFDGTHYYTLGSGSDALDSSGDFWSCHVFYGNGIGYPVTNGTENVDGWYLQTFNNGSLRFATSWSGAHNNLDVSSGNCGLLSSGVNVVCVGRSGTTKYVKCNAKATVTGAEGTIAAGTSSAATIGAGSFPGTYYEGCFSSSPASDTLFSSITAAVVNKIQVQ